MGRDGKRGEEGKGKWENVGQCGGRGYVGRVGVRRDVGLCGGGGGEVCEWVWEGPLCLPNKLYYRAHSTTTNTCTRAKYVCTHLT